MEQETLAKLRMFSKNLIFQGFRLCLHELPCKGARMTPKDWEYDWRYGQQLSIGTKCVALPWNRSQQHPLNYAYLVKT